MPWEDIVSDSRWKDLPEEKKQSVADKYFQKNIASDPRYSTFDSSKQESIRNKFFEKAGLRQQSFIEKVLPKPIIDLAKNLSGDVRPAMEREGKAMRAYETTELSAEDKADIKAKGKQFKEDLAKIPGLDLKSHKERLAEDSAFIEQEYIVKPFNSVIGKAMQSLDYLAAGVMASEKNKEFLYKDSDDIDEWLKLQAPSEKVGAVGRFVRGVEELGAKILTGPAAIPLFLMEAGATGKEYTDKGIDQGTATALTALNIGVTAAFTQVPMGGKTFAGGAARGAVVNPIIGSASRAVEKGILLAGGYKKEADEIKIGDLEESLKESLMGIGFGLHQTISLKANAGKIAKAIENGEILPEHYKRYNLQKLYGEWGSKEFETSFPSLKGMTEPVGEAEQPKVSPWRAKIEAVRERYKPRVEPIKAQEPLITETPLRRGSDVDIDNFRALMKEEGIDPDSPRGIKLVEAHAKDVGMRSLDEGTGYQTRVEYHKAMPAIGKRAAAGEHISYTEFDLPGTKAANADLGRPAVDKHLNAKYIMIKDIVSKEIPDAQFLRNGGDEGQIISKAPKDVQERVIEKAREAVRQYDKEHDLAKYAGHDAGLYHETVNLEEFSDWRDAVDNANIRVEANKVAKKGAKGEQTTREAGTGKAEVKPESAKESAGGKAVGVGKEKEVGKFVTDEQRKALEDLGFERAEIDAIKPSEVQKVIDTETNKPSRYKGTNLRPAIMQGDKKYIGEEGQSHADILQAHGLKDEGDRGFATPRGKFMDRDESLVWMYKHQPEQAKEVELKDGELHSQEYAKAVGLRKTEAEPAVKETPKPQAEPTPVPKAEEKAEPIKVVKKEVPLEEVKTPLDKSYDEDREPTEAELKEMEKFEAEALADLDRELKETSVEEDKVIEKQLNTLEKKIKKEKEEVPTAGKKFIEPPAFKEGVVDKPVEDLAKEMSAILKEMEGLRSQLTSEEFEGSENTIYDKLDMLEEKYRLLNRSGEKKEPGFFIRLMKSQQGGWRREEEKRDFYSQLKKVITEKLPAKAEAYVVKRIVENPQYGVKQEELKWSGISEWLESKGKEKVSREEVLAKLKEGQVQVREVIYGKAWDKKIDNDLRQLIEKNFKTGDFEDLGGDVSVEQYIEHAKAGRNAVTWETLEFRGVPKGTILELQDRVENAQKAAPQGKFSQYKTPGGENYREVLFTLPPKSDIKDKKGMRDAIEADLREGIVSRDDYEKALHEEGLESIYKSPHWDEPNVLAHTRVQDFIDEKGNRVLFVEEVQSDWAQKGRREGFRPKDTPINKVEKLRELEGTGENEYRVSTEGAGWITVSAPNEGAAIEIARDTAADLGYNLEKTGVPSMPFPKTWHELVMKRMLREAAEKGYDKVAWTPGSVHTERWGTERIEWKKQPDGTFLVNAKSQHGGVAGGVDLEVEGAARGLTKENSVIVKNKEELENAIPSSLTEGQDPVKVSDKIWNRMQSEEKGVSHPRKEGFEGFYDKIIVDFMNKYTKKWGGKVESSEIKVGKVKIDKEEISDAARSIEQYIGNHTESNPKSIGDRIISNMVKKLEDAGIRVEQNEGDLSMVGFVAPGGEDFLSSSEIVAHFPAAPKEGLQKVHSVTITPEMRSDITTKGQPLFSGIPVSEGIQSVRDALTWLGKTETIDGLKRNFAAVTREGSETAAGILSEEASIAARNQDMFEHGMKTAQKYLAKLGKGANLDFMERMDIGAQQRTPELQGIADALQAMFEHKVEAIRRLGTGALDEVRDNYFPHMWKSRTGSKDILATLAKRPFKGSEAFKKQRVYDDIRAGIDAGLEPISYNPVEVATLKLMEMDKYIVANKTINSLKEVGEIKFFRTGTKPQSGEWTRINDKFSTVWRPVKDASGKITGRTIAGHYYAKDPSAQILNNYLSTNLYSEGGIGKIFTAYMGVANNLNQFQLGFFSAFHAGFTSFETVISQGALGIRQLSEGRLGDAAKSFAKAPTAWISNPKFGDKIMKEWLSPGTQGAEIAAIVHALQSAGGRLHSIKGEQFQTTHTKRLLENWRSGTVGGKVKATALTPFAIVEQSARPILEMLVPRQKFGVFGELMNDWMKQNPDATHAEMRSAARQFWNRTDSRLGQVVYDRLFANNIAKNIVQGLIRAPGWTGGTILEVGGGATDSIKFIADVLQGKPHKVTDRMAYTLSLLATTAVINSALTFAFTGEKPTQDDLWSFRTGRKDRYGKDERFVLPTYAKDIYSYMKQPGTTLKHKIHPALSMGYDVVIANKDTYTNTQIRDEDANLITQLAQVGGHVVKQFEPFWLRGNRKAREVGTGIGGQAAPLVGINPAPRIMTSTDAEILMYDISQKKRSVGGYTKAEAEKIQGKKERAEAYAKGELDEADLTGKEAKELAAGLDDVGRFKKVTGRFSPHEIMRVWKVMTDDEKIKYRDIVQKKIQNSKSLVGEEREKYLEQIEVPTKTEKKHNTTSFLESSPAEKRKVLMSMTPSERGAFLERINNEA